MKEITYKELEKIVQEQPAAFLCGNGFSINFDSDFANIYDRLYEAHKLLIRSGKYDVKANNSFNKIFKDNYKSVSKYVYTYKHKDIEKVFVSGIYFADSIIKDVELMGELNNNGYVHKLVFDKTELDLVESIASVGKKWGYRSVNIEYWSILIYMFFAISALKTEKYEFPKNNEFITLIKLGNINKNRLVPGTDDIYQFVLSNGFNTYYRMLFATAILCNGKAVNFFELSNLYNLKLDEIRAFLDKYKVLMTLNYDHILENISSRPVQHIHGQYVQNEKEYVYYQSLGIDLNLETYISFSDILIGDYFTNKTFAGVINVMNKNPINKKVSNIVKIVGTCMEKSEIEVMVIFGMNIDNDQHILRDIMLRFSEMPSKDVKIVYCYFTEEDRDVFNEQYEASITFRKDVSNRVKQTELLYIKTQDILQAYFTE
ncbi:MAG: hypothetical protein HDQ98_16490 [Lachnospiraceae bacterium]|nr:hypothetical protein [Lachnospiraceae bacterium]